MGIASTAGQNVRQNVAGLNLGDLVANAYHSTMSGLANNPLLPTTPIVSAIGAGRDFISGLMGGAAPVHTPAQAAVAKVAAQPAPKAAADAGQPSPLSLADIAQAYDRGTDRAARSANPVMSAIKDYMGGGGNLSLNMIAALAHAQNESSSLNKVPKVQTAADKTFGAASDAIDNYYNSQLAAAEKKGDNTLVQKILKDHMNDRMTLAHGVSQVDLATGRTITGANPDGS